MKKPTRETKQNKEAFEYFYKLGADRTLQKVCKRFAKSRVWATAVAKKFDWKNRAAERDQDVQDDSLDDYDAKLKQAKRENFKIISMIKGGLMEKLNELKGKAQRMEITITEFERIAKLELLMLGDPTERISDDTLTGMVKDAEEYLAKTSNQRGH